MNIKLIDIEFWIHISIFYVFSLFECPTNQQQNRFGTNKKKVKNKMPSSHFFSDSNCSNGTIGQQQQQQEAQKDIDHGNRKNVKLLLLMVIDVYEWTSMNKTNKQNEQNKTNEQTQHD